MSEPILCYVDNPWAYFTTQPLEKQWGDDWNDAPYEYNAGTPYEWHEPDGEPRWEIVTVGYHGDFWEPGDRTLNSPYSVETINAGAVPWLAPFGGSPGLFAGAPLAEFKRFVWEHGGRIFTEETLLPFRVRTYEAPEVS